MMKENNDISLAGVDAQCTKNIPQHLLGAVYLVRTYLMTDAKI